MSETFNSILIGIIIALVISLLGLGFFKTLEYGTSSEPLKECTRQWYDDGGNFIMVQGVLKNMSGVLGNHINVCCTRDNSICLKIIKNNGLI